VAGIFVAIKHCPIRRSDDELSLMHEKAGTIT